MAEQQNPEKGKKKNRKRGAEILGIFAKHNFYSNGFTPVELRTTLEDLGPTYVKIGQIMSSRTDMLPKEYCRELEKLRSTVKPLPSELAREVIEEETGKTIDEIYSEFRDEPLGSASIGQAHYGVLKDGTRVVTKVQRPGIADMMREDFVLLKKLAGMVSMSAEDDDEVETIDLKGILEELEKVSHREYNTGFFYGREPGQVTSDGGYIRKYEVVAVCDDYKDGTAYLTQRNRFFAGDTLDVLPPSGIPFNVKIETMFNENNEQIDAAPHAMQKLTVPSAVEIPKGSLLRKKRIIEK